MIENFIIWFDGVAEEGTKESYSYKEKFHAILLKSTSCYAYSNIIIIFIFR